MKVSYVLTAWVSISIGFFGAGMFLGRFMRALRTGHTLSAAWNAFLSVACMTFMGFVTLYDASGRFKHAIPYDVIGVAMAIYVASLVVIRLMTGRHIKFIELMALAGCVAGAAAAAEANPPVFLLIAIIVIIGWKITGSQSYADGMLFRDHLVDRARDYREGKGRLR
jgi:hypothetical protein